MENLYEYLFHYNPFEEMWYAFKREDYSKYFNGNRNIASKNRELEDLISDLLEKTHTKK